MSEAIWGIIGVVIGGIIGLIGNFINSRSVRQTTEYQLNFQADQARVNRILERRATYLNPLKECLVDGLEKLLRLRDQIGRLKAEIDYVPRITRLPVRDESKLKRVDLSESIEELDKATENIDTFKNDIETFESQVNDEKLGSLLMGISWDCLNVSLSIHRLRIACVTWQQKDKHEVPTRPSFDEIDADLMQFIGRIRETNIRIEELLIRE